MSYIGRGTDAISNVEKLDNITFNGGTTYALTKSSAAFTPVGANNILVSIDGVIQQGNFSVSTTNIVFDWSPTSSNTCNFILHYGTGVLNVPADGSIVAAKMAANSVDSDSYVDGSIDAVHLSANSVDSDAYVDGSIDAVHLSANSVDSDAYVDASIDNAHLADDAVGVAELSATGTASSSTFLRGDNARAIAGGGKILQVQHSTYATSDTTTSTSYEATTMSDNITCAATSSKVLVMFNIAYSVYASSSATHFGFAAIYKDVGGGGYSVLYPAAASSQIGGYSHTGVSAERTFKGNSTLTYVDSPSTTSEITYKLYIAYANGTNFVLAPANSTCSITLIEIGA